MVQLPVYPGFENLNASKPLAWLAQLNLPVVEVGCGDGSMIAWMRATYGTQVVGVDPAPGEFEERPVVRHPDCSTVSALLKTRSDLVGQCALLIVRPYPNGYDANPYDWVAVQRLKPKVMLFLYRSEGSDGSGRLHDLMRVHGCPCNSYADPKVPAFDPTMTQVLPEDQREYHTWATKYTARIDPPAMIAIPTCTVLVRKDAGIALGQNWPLFEQNPDAPDQAEVRRLFLLSLTQCTLQ